MCKAPNTLEDGTEVACRKCSLCRERAINDWVGRNVAESKTAKACHAVTLTYGRNSANDVLHERSVILTYSDVQKYLKLLRRHGYPVRYFVTGEFGSANGRAHWHIMLYWLDKVPPHELDKRPGFMEEHWPHGYSFWTRPTAQAIRYNCKYIQKDMGDGDNARQGHLAMSKKPPLGAVYFQNWAERHVEAGLAPQTLEYSFPEVRRTKKDGSEQMVPFLLTGRSAELFLEHYIATWRKVHGNKPWPNSELVDLFHEYGKVVTDEGRLVRLQNPRLRRWVPPDEVKPKTKPSGFVWMDEKEWQSQFDKENGSGTEQQRQVEQWWREHHDEVYFKRLVGHKKQQH